MSNPTQEQRLNCMALAGMRINQQEYIKHYRGSMVNVVINRPVEFPTLAKFRDEPNSPELAKELQKVFGFSDFSDTNWVCNVRARIDIEDFARQPVKGPSLWLRIKDSLASLGLDP